MVIHDTADRGLHIKMGPFVNEVKIYEKYSSN